MKEIEVESHDWQFFNMLVKEKIDAGYIINSEIKKIVDEDGRIIGYSQRLIKM